MYKNAIGILLDLTLVYRNLDRYWSDAYKYYEKWKAYSVILISKYFMSMFSAVAYLVP